jgi:HlyD family secretion protein
MGLVGVGVVLALATATAVSVHSLFLARGRNRLDRDHVVTVPVRRTDLNVHMRTGGQVESTERTVIECALENIEYRTRGVSRSVGGASTILEVIPEGTLVKKGDVLCVMDASEYEELVRTQLINVDRARADYKQAELNLQVARIAVGEYRDGIMAQMRKDLRGQIALAESDQERAENRLVWSKRMLEKGYLPKSQVTAEEFSLSKLSLNLKKGRTALEMFEKWHAPLYLKILNSDVLTAESMFDHQVRRLQRFEERLAYYQRQVDSCTIRAPHDGYVIYFTDDRRRDVLIEPGMMVRQRQKLFYLPDLSQMEVSAMLHESVAHEVRTGMRARVKVEALPDRVVEGHVEQIAQLPTQNLFNDVRYFVGTVRLDTIPKGLMPGMSAEVDITTVHKPEVLVIPVEALAVEGGQDVCYVARESGIERREVRIGQVTSELLEVTRGLDEGEEVVMDPSHTFNPVATAPADESPADSQPSLGAGE